MTATRRSARQCPLPPADFSARQIPELALNLGATTLYRIHRTAHAALFFTRRSKTTEVYRFDAPNDEFGVLYASASFEVCMAEAVIRDKFIGSTLPLLLDELANFPGTEEFLEKYKIILIPVA